jgi:hypothetical protein
MQVWGLPAADRFQFIPRNLEDLLASAELRSLLCPRQPRINSSHSCTGAHAVYRIQMVHLIFFIYLDVIFIMIEWFHHPSGSAQSPVPKSGRRSKISLSLLKCTYHLLIELTLSEQLPESEAAKNKRAEGSTGVPQFIFKWKCSCIFLLFFLPENAFRN